MNKKSLLAKQFSVIVPTVGRDENLDQLLKKLSLQKLKNFEVILVFRKISKKQKKSYSKKHKKLKLVFLEQKGDGLVNARNTGLFYSRSKYVVFTDDDVSPSRNWLFALNKVFENSPDIVGATGPSIIPRKYHKNRDLTMFIQKLSKGSYLWKAIGKLFFWVIYENKQYEVGKWFKSGAFSLGANYRSKSAVKNQEVMDLQACNFACRRDEVLKVDGFDKKFSALASYSESDLAFRLRELGGRLMYSPDAKIYHLPSKSGVFSERSKTKTEIENYLLFYFRHIKITNLITLLRFLIYFFIILTYRSVYQSIVSKSLDPALGVIYGVVTGFATVITDSKRLSYIQKKIALVKSSLSKYFLHPSVLLWRSIELVAVAENLKKINKVAPMLDLGCGEGKVAEIIFGRKKIDYGIDPDRQMVNKSKKYGVYKKVVMGDARKMPFQDETFNFVFSNSVIEHIPKVEMVISEVSRILKKGGDFMFTVPNDNLRKNLFFTKIFTFFRLGSVGKKYSDMINNQLDHFNLYSNKRWEKVLKKRGLKVKYIANYLNPEQTMAWDFGRVILYPFMKLSKQKAHKRFLAAYSRYITKNINSWRVDHNDGSCTIIIASKI